ncbi:uncharacterized protein LOC135366315 [Ornithodoros turicata]|uniref:uncharacterized protein LOC135366315 n=1 Tax=Ornithodoros turicata TaxID=34597 RepID=UPI00313A2543
MENVPPRLRWSSKGKFCCVYECHNNQWDSSNAETPVIFYSFPGKPYERERKERWVTAVRRAKWSKRHIQSMQLLADVQVLDETQHMALPEAEDTNSSLDSTDPLEYTCTMLDCGTQTEDDQSMPLCGATIAASFSVFLCTITSDGAASQILHKTTRDASTSPAVIATVTSSSGPTERQCWFAGYESVAYNSDALHGLTNVSAAVFALLLSVLQTAATVREGDISLPNKLLLFLMKLKLGISFVSLSFLFGIHPSTASRIFQFVLYKLASATRDWIFVPSRASILSASPPCFKLHYPTCTFILDCTEIRTETPPTVQQQRALFSAYKNGYTVVKFLVGVLPNGMVAFISKAYAGRATDSFITVNSGFLNHVQRGDVILSDKGFPGIRTDMKNLDVVLVMPPFSSGGQFSEEEMRTTYNIAQVRIHAERVIQRIKIFNVLNTQVPVRLLPHIDNIFHMCCVLVNLQSPIIKVQ